MIYYICGVPCIEICMESDHKKSFFYAGRYFVKVSDYNCEEEQKGVRIKWFVRNIEKQNKLENALERFS